MAQIVGQASLRHVLRWRAVSERPSVSHARGWGPVLEDAAAAAGCQRAAASVVIIPEIAPSVLAAALRCVPADVLPRVDDTRESLAARLGASPFLDDAHVLNAGNGKRGAGGKKRRRLNETCVLRSTSTQVLVSGCQSSQRRRRRGMGGVALQLQRLRPFGRGRALHTHAVSRAVSG